MASSFMTNKRISSQAVISELIAHFSFFGLKLNKAAPKSPECEDSMIEPMIQNKPDCGGYNEAFVFQYWANFDPHS